MTEHRKRKHSCGEELIVLDDRPYIRIPFDDPNDLYQLGAIVIENLLYYCPKCDDICHYHGRKKMYSLKSCSRPGLRKGVIEKMVREAYGLGKYKTVW
jgi:hypothetical protein